MSLNGQKIHQMSLDEKWFDLVKNGEKTLEGRFLDEKREDMKQGDLIEFTNREDPNKKLMCEVKYIAVYGSLIVAMSALDLYDKMEYLLPGIKDVEEAVNLYMSINGYKEKNKKYLFAIFSIECV